MAATNGKTACIVGASRGIGLGLARHLAEAGYTVHATERTASADLNTASDACGGAIVIHRVDVTDPASVAELATAMPANSIDLLVMNAGIYGGDAQQLEDLDEENVSDILMTNAVSTVQATLALLPSMKDGASIGLMSSKMGSIEDSSGGANLYRLSKVAQNMLARSLFEKHAKERGIAVTSLHPGWVQTDMGGPNALITVDESVSGMIDVLENADAAEHRFMAYDGTPIGW